MNQDKQIDFRHEGANCSDLSNPVAFAHLMRIVEDLHDLDYDAAVKDFWDGYHSPLLLQDA